MLTRAGCESLWRAAAVDNGLRPISTGVKLSDSGVAACVCAGAAAFLGIKEPCIGFGASSAP